MNSFANDINIFQQSVVKRKEAIIETQKKPTIGNFIKKEHEKSFVKNLPIENEK